MISFWMAFKLWLIGNEAAVKAIDEIIRKDRELDTKKKRGEMYFSGTFKKEIEIYLHWQWSEWFKKLVEVSKVNVDKSVTIPAPIAVEMGKASTRDLNHLTQKYSDDFKAWGNDLVETFEEELNK